MTPELRRDALSKEIARWMNGGKERTITKLERATGICRKTLTTAANGSGDVNVFYMQRILTVICTPKEIFEFHVRYIPEAMPLLDALQEGKAKFFNSNVFTETECRILIDAAMGETRIETYLLRGVKEELDAIKHLREQGMLSRNAEFLSLQEKVSFTHGQTIDSLLKYLAKKFDSKKEWNSVYTFFGNCDQKTKDRVLAWKEDCQKKLAEIIRDYEPGPHKIAGFVFTTKL